MASSGIDLSGRVALITGGARGMGFGTAELLLSRGASVALATRTKAELESALARLNAGDRATLHVCDVADENAVAELIEGVLAAHGRLDILLCSHGIYPGVRRVTEISGEEFDRTVAVNLRGAFLAAAAAARQMDAQKQGGRIVFISSMNALASQFGAADYDASKAGLHGLMRAMAVELAADGITVNTIAPGWIRTEMSADELEHLSDRVLNPSRKVGTPDDIARAVLWLVDPANAYVTGSTIVIDGGQTAMLPNPWREGDEVLAS